MAHSNYAWAAGHNVALALLINIENELYLYNYREVGGARRPVGIRSEPVELYPVRRRTLDQNEQRNGSEAHYLEVTCTVYAYKYVTDTYLQSEAVTSADMTFYLRRHEYGEYQRYNGKLILPSRHRGEIAYLRHNLLRVRFPITGLEAL